MEVSVAAYFILRLAEALVLVASYTSAAARTPAHAARRHPPANPFVVRAAGASSLGIM